MDAFVDFWRCQLRPFLEVILIAMVLSLAIVLTMVAILDEPTKPVDLTQVCSAIALHRERP